MLLVCGATGRTGTEVLRALRDSKLQVRGLFHRDEGRDAVKALGAEPVQGDLGDPKSLAPALEGVTKALLIAPSSPMQSEYEQVFIESATQAGVQHIVKLSMLGASPGSPLRFAKAHGVAEVALRNSGITWTLLRASGFMQNTLAWPAHIHDGVLHAPVPDAAFAPVDTRDVAEVAVAALTGDGHDDRAYALTGPQAVSYRAQAAKLFGAAGRRVEVREVALEALKQALVRGGAPPWNAEGLGELLESYASGRAATVATGVQDALGRPPRDLDAFARDHRGAFTVDGEHAGGRRTAQAAAGPADPDTEADSDLADPPAEAETGPAEPPTEAEAGPAEPPTTDETGPADPPAEAAAAPADPPAEAQAGPAEPPAHEEAAGAAPPHRSEEEPRP